MQRWHPTPVLLLGKSNGWRSLVGCSPWGSLRVGQDWATSLSLFSSCIGEGNGNPLQCSCLENLWDGGAWWAAAMGSHRVGHDWSALAAAAAVHVNTWLPCTVSQSWLTESRLHIQKDPRQSLLPNSTETPSQTCGCEALPTGWCPPHKVQATGSWGDGI